MNIQLASDLHFEWHRDQGKSFISSMNPDDVDVLLLPGDIITLRNTDPLYRICDKYKKVIYIIGNHELYDLSVEEGLEIFNSLSHPNLITLNNSLVEIDGQRFLGSTLWFNEEDVKRHGTQESFLNDFYKIEGFKPWVYEEHLRSVKFLKENVRENDVILSHHLPSFQCVAPRWRMNAHNCFFASNQDEIILHGRGKLWAFGHSHDSCDITIGSTRMINNAFGYAGYEENPDFKDKFMVEI